ncbi:prephenate dehydratase [Corticicoccus populi]|uniref:Prephenate dehydratase n=1 Tax=Corticicoccus populi TaxID=1812821 RepID=A0ABW5X292_9STAP
MLIGYQGVPGSYSTVACQKFMGENQDHTKGFLTFRLLVDALLNDEVDYIALPVENSTSGPITRTIDLMKYLDVEATDEVYVKIDHALITKHPIELSKITKVYSHPEALEQCYTYLSQYPNIEVLEYRDTAGAVEMVKNSKDETIASIAGSHAAEMYDMTVIRENISDNPLNTTRFLFFKKKNGRINRVQDKTSIYIETGHSTGSLSDVLQIFKKHENNLVYLMSRPIQAKPFSYGFFIDVDSGLGNAAFSRALEELKEICTYINILGSYPEGIIPSYEGVIQNEANINS